MSAGNNIKTQDVEGLIELFKASSWDEMHVQVGEFELFLSNDPTATGPGRAPTVPVASSVTSLNTAPPSATLAVTPASSPNPVSVVIPAGLVAIRAPNLGTFYRAPKPGAPHYVEVGQTIEAHTEICLIEVMKLFAPVAAGVRGVVREVLVKDGEMVEFDALLMFIEPAK